MLSLPDHATRMAWFESSFIGDEINNNVLSYSGNYLGLIGKHGYATFDCVLFTGGAGIITMFRYTSTTDSMNVYNLNINNPTHQTVTIKSPNDGPLMFYNTDN